MYVHRPHIRQSNFRFDPVIISIGPVLYTNDLWLEEAAQLKRFLNEYY